MPLLPIPPGAPVSWGSGVLAALKRALNTVGGLVGYPATGTASATTYLRGDGTWATPASGSGTLTAGTTPTSGFTAGQLLMSDGTNLQAASAAKATSLTLGGDVPLNRDAAGILAQQNGTTAQTVRAYNTWSSAGANYERGVFDWQTTANVLTIGTESGGTGVARNLKFVVNGVNVLDYGVTTAGHLTASVGNFDVNSGGNSQQLTLTTTSNTNTVILFKANGTNIVYFGRISGVFGVFSGDASALLTFSGAGASSVTASPGTISAPIHRHPPAATFPASPSAGDIAAVNTATTPTIGSAVALGGAAFALGVYNGTQWTCIGN